MPTSIHRLGVSASLSLSLRDTHTEREDREIRLPRSVLLANYILVRVFKGLAALWFRLPYTWMVAHIYTWDNSMSC